MKKNMLLGLFVFCICGVALMFNVQTTRSDNMGFVCVNIADGVDTNISGYINISDRTLNQSASENQFKYKIHGRGEFDTVHTVEVGVNTGITHTTQNTNKTPSSGSRVTHLKVEEIITTEEVLPIDDNQMASFQAGLGNRAYLNEGSNNTEMWGSRAGVEQVVEYDGVGYNKVGGKAYLYEYLGPSDHGGSFPPPPDWTKDTMYETDKDIIDFEITLHGPHSYYGQHVIVNPNIPTP